MSMGKKQTIGYKYHLGMHLVLCHGPIDAITRIEVGDKEVWTGSNTGGSLSISKGDIFGGDESEGGISGTLDVDMGSSTQGVNSYLASKLGEYTPAFRGVVSLILRQMYLGNSQYIKQWKVRGKRTKKRTDGSAMWYSSKAEISGSSMNPAHIIHECLTDKEWGLGYPAADIDLVALTAAADTLYAEGMGISLLWDSSSAIEDFIKTILEHIDGSLYVDRATGRFKLKLSRNDYNASTLLVLDEDSIRELTSLKRSSQAELYNSVTVKYWDIRTGDTNTVTVQDIALAAQQGRTVGTTVDYPGFTSAELANKVAMRDLKALSTPLLSCTLIANRVAANLNPGDVFKLSWPRNGIDNVVMRVVSVDIGTTSDTQVRIECVEDVFALGTAVYSTPPTTGWEHPSSAPAASPFRSVIEAPYWEVASMLTDPVASALPVDVGYVLATGSRPSGDALNAIVMSDRGGAGYVDTGVVDFCPVAILSADVDRLATSFPITGAVDLDLVRIGTYALIGDEAVAVKVVDSTSVHVDRGVLDTLPLNHLTGSIIYFVEDYFKADTEQYGAGETVSIKLLPVTAKGTLSVASAPANSVMVQGRATRPYPPANVKLSGSYRPASVYGTFTLSWASRNRLQQSGGPHVSWYSDSISPEPGVTTSVILKRPGGTVVYSEDGITATSKSIPLAGEGGYKLELLTKLGSQESWKKYTHSFEYTVIAPGIYTPEVLSIDSGNSATVSTLHSIPLPTYNASDLVLVLFACSNSTTVTSSAGWGVSSLTAGSTVTVGYSIRTVDMTEPGNMELTLGTASSVSYTIYRVRGGTFEADYSGTPILTLSGYASTSAVTNATLNLRPLFWEPKNELLIGFVAIDSPLAGQVTSYSLPDNNNTQTLAGSVALATMSKATPTSRPESFALTMSASDYVAAMSIAIRGKFTPDYPEARLFNYIHNTLTSWTSLALSNLGTSEGPGTLAIAIMLADGTHGRTTPAGWTNAYSANYITVCYRVIAEADIGTSVTFAFSGAAHHLVAVHYVKAGTFNPDVGVAVVGYTSGTSASGSLVVSGGTAASRFNLRRNTVLTQLYHFTSPYYAVSAFPDTYYYQTFNVSPGGICYYGSNSTVTGDTIPSKAYTLGSSIGSWSGFHIVVEGFN